MSEAGLIRGDWEESAQYSIENLGYSHHKDREVHFISTEDLDRIENDPILLVLRIEGELEKDLNRKDPELLISSVPLKELMEQTGSGPKTSDFGEGSDYYSLFIGSENRNTRRSISEVNDLSSLEQGSSFYRYYYNFYGLHFAEGLRVPNRKLTRYYARLTHSDPENFIKKQKDRGWTMCLSHFAFLHSFLELYAFPITSRDHLSSELDPLFGPSLGESDLSSVSKKESLV
ncbi:hypothetical protein EHQ64_18595 [Leptospira sarikeiensis]|uniref:Uncharacterized protein n=1 Tax=Leptospira sarikeiensis TaxID=2484943 RepID=A0A4R9K0C9_9LEPT|nr:hypothetical protein EHQ64_18595 [Leptospira sarikeiensis]